MPKYLREELTGETPERNYRLAWRIADFFYIIIDYQFYTNLTLNAILLLILNNTH